jgi:hypothetical protein
MKRRELIAGLGSAAVWRRITPSAVSLDITEKYEFVKRTR